MEFATEVYLNDLLLNAEANGFESAKESFYECIGLDSDIAMESDESNDTASNNTQVTQNTEKTGIFQKLIDIIVKVLKLIWDILTFIPKWIYKKIVELGNKYKVINNARDKVDTLPKESLAAIDNYLTAVAKVYKPNADLCVSIINTNYMSNLATIINKVTNSTITSNDVSNGAKLAEDATEKINQATKKFEDDIASLNQLKSKIDLGDSQIQSIDLAIAYYRASAGIRTRIDLYSANKHFCDDGAKDAKVLLDSINKIQNSANTNELKALLPKISTASNAYLKMVKCWQQIVMQHFSTCFASGIIRITNKETGKVSYHTGSAT